jgi:hypothetical protein
MHALANSLGKAERDLLRETEPKRKGARRQATRDSR